MALSHRVLQVLLGLLYRLIGWGAPMQFYLHGCFLLFGLGMGAMCLLGSLLSGPTAPSRAWLLRGCLVQVGPSGGCWSSLCCNATGSRRAEFGTPLCCARTLACLSS